MVQLQGNLRPGATYTVALDDPNSQLGRGVSAMVFKATLHQPPGAAPDPTPEKAIKFMPLLPDVDHLRRTKLEILVLNRLNHNHVVKMFDLVCVPLFDFRLPTPHGQLKTFRAPAIGLVMERAKCSLQTYMENRQGISEGYVRWWFQQLMLAVDYCHRKGIAQRDIKPGNMLLFRTRSSDPAMSDALILRVADFGWVRDTSLSLATTEAGTPLYMAPEIPREDDPLAGGAHHHHLQGMPPPAVHYQACKADIWSCGVVLFHMLFPERVALVVDYQAVDDRGRYHNWLAQLADICSRPEQMTRSWLCVDLLQRMLQTDPAQRYTVAEVMSHPWFTDRLPPGAHNLTEESLDNPPLVAPDRLEAFLNDEIAKFYPYLAGHNL